MTDTCTSPRASVLDTMLAFRDFELASTWGVRVESDPLGPVNKIVRLMRGQRCLKSVLWPVPAGADVRLVRSLPWLARRGRRHHSPVDRRRRFPRLSPCAAQSVAHACPVATAQVVLRRRGSRRRAAGISPRG